MGALEGKVVLVTGGGNGLGRECALIAAEEGAKVVVNDFGGGVHGNGPGSSTPAEQVVEQIRARGGQAVANADSVTSLKAVQGMAQQALDTFGGLHAVIHAAGILRDIALSEMSEDDWDRVIEVHLRGAFNVARATIERFLGQQDGAYMFFSSVSGFYGNVGQANYGAAKLGIAALSRTIALEGAGRKVRSNCLAPVAWTRMAASMPLKPEVAAVVSKFMAENARADQSARVAVALVSPAATATGQILGSEGEEITLYSQPRPVETVVKAGGWSVSTILSEALPRMEAKFTGLERLPTPAGLKKLLAAG